jgi:hypothetical protein
LHSCAASVNKQTIWLINIIWQLRLWTVFGIEPNTGGRNDKCIDNGRQVEDTTTDHRCACIADR